MIGAYVLSTRRELRHTIRKFEHDHSQHEKRFKHLTIVKITQSIYHSYLRRCNGLKKLW